MVVLGVPTAMLRDSRNECDGAPDLWSIPTEYLTAAGLYSNAHVLKCYEVGAAPLPSTAPDEQQLSQTSSTTLARSVTPPRTRFLAAAKVVQGANALGREAGSPARARARVVMKKPAATQEGSPPARNRTPSPRGRP